MTPLPKDFQKKEKIITAAFTVFARDGLAKGTIASIAKEAGIGKGTVYEYFSSKDEIFLGLIEFFFHQMLSSYKDAIISDLPPVQKLETIIAETFYSMDQLMLSDFSFSMMILLEIFLYAFRLVKENPDDTTFSEIFKHFYDMLQPVIDEGVTNGDFKDVDSDYVGFLFFASLDGIALHYYLQHRRFDTDKMVDIAKTLFMNGILK